MCNSKRNNVANVFSLGQGKSGSMRTLVLYVLMISMNSHSQIQTEQEQMEESMNRERNSVQTAAEPMNTALSVK